MQVKRLLLLFGVLSAVVIIGLVFAFRSKAFDSFLKQKIIAAAAPNARLSIGGFSFSGTVIEMEGVEAYFPRQLFGLTVDKLRIGLALWPLIVGVPDIQIALGAYGGSADLHLTSEPGGAIRLAAVDIRQIDLSGHPQLAGSGLESGTISLKGAGLLFAPALQEGALEASLAKVTLSRDSLLFYQLHIPGELVPQIENASFHAPITIEHGRLESKQVELSLGFADFRGSGALTLDARGVVKDFKVDGTVELKRDGPEKIGPFLPALSNEKVAATETRFRISGSGTPRNPRWTVLPAG